MLWINFPKHPPIHGSYMSHFKLNIFFHKWKMSQIGLIRVSVNVPTSKVHFVILHALSTARIFYLKNQFYIRLYKLFSLNICASFQKKKKKIWPQIHLPHISNTQFCFLYIWFLGFRYHFSFWVLTFSLGLLLYFVRWGSHERSCSHQPQLSPCSSHSWLGSQAWKEPSHTLQRNQSNNQLFLHCYC